MAQVAPEPKALKKAALKDIETTGEPKALRRDSALASWMYHRGWKEILQANGKFWGTLQKAIRENIGNARLWVTDDKTWAEFEEEIVDYIRAS